MGTGLKAHRRSSPARSNSLTVALSSLINNLTAAGQEVSSIELFLTTLPGTVSLTNATGTTINIAPGGAVTPGCNQPLGHDGIWGRYFPGHGRDRLGRGSPVDLIIGSGPYTNANPSITGRNPQIQNTGTFTLTLTGVPNPSVTGVTFGFGTGPDSHLTGTCTADCGTVTQHGSVPEPASWAMMLVGFEAWARCFARNAVV